MAIGENSGTADAANSAAVEVASAAAADPAAAALSTDAAVSTRDAPAGSDGPRRALPYLPGLDGLRAVAVVAVILYHLDLPWMAGGFLGVEVFFVISGYLITTLLLGEWEATGRIGVRAFWGRRARRLLPALFALLAGVGAFAVWYALDNPARVRADVLAALTYITNWYLIFQQESYFEAMGRPSLFKHLWSLAVEEQFYILWPLAFLLGLRFLRQRGFLVAVLLTVVLSAGLMGWLYVPGGDPSRVYYGTDTRAFGLLLGAALAMVWRPWLAPALGASRRRAIDLTALAALGGLLAVFVILDENNPLLFPGGFLVVDALTLALIAAVAVPGSKLGRGMGLGLLVWVGLRSYAIYLWHWPVFMVTRPWVDVTWTGAPLLILRLALTLILAEVSFQLVEQPLRRRDTWAVRPLLVSFSRLFAGATAVALVLAVGWPLLRAAAPDAAAADASLPTTASADVAGSATQSRPAGANVALADSSGVAAVTVRGLAQQTPAAGRMPRRPVERRQLDATVAPIGARFVPRPTGTPAARGPSITETLQAARVTFLGDSVMLGASTALRERFGEDVLVDADVSRQYGIGLERMAALRTGGAIGQVLVIHLGNNGTVTDEQLAETMTLVGDVPYLYFLTVRVPRKWEEPVNASLWRASRRWPHIRLLDWYTASAGLREHFTNDGVHLRPEGARIYADFIAQQVLSDLRSGLPTGRSGDERAGPR